MGFQNSRTYVMAHPTEILERFSSSSGLQIQKPAGTKTLLSVGHFPIHFIVDFIITTSPSMMCKKAMHAVIYATGAAQPDCSVSDF